MKNIINLNQVSAKDVQIVGGKNASTGEMIKHLSRQGILVPGGFATTAHAYQQFLAQRGLDKKIYATLAALNAKNVRALRKASEQIQQWILKTPFTPAFAQEILAAYKKLNNGVVAVRSSATAEDLAAASFAGAQESYLNIKGNKHLLDAIKRVYASLFTSRAISYRSAQGFAHEDVAISAAVQPMIRSDKGVSGVIFTLDTESGFDEVILINASYGLGEALAQGMVNPDEFVVYKPLLKKNKSAILEKRLGEKAVKMIYTQSKRATHSTQIAPVPEKERLRFSLSEKDIHTLAQQALLIEKHYGRPMDIEWAKDGVSGKLYILQARPETVKSRQVNSNGVDRYILSKRESRGLWTKCWPAYWSRRGAHYFKSETYADNAAGRSVSH